MKTIKINDNTSVRWVAWDHPANNATTEPTEEAMNRFRRFISPGDLVVDIGAWCGDTTILFALLTGRSGKVVAFEPNPNSFRVLQCNAFLNSDSYNIECHNVAIMPESGDYLFHYSDPLFCNGGFADGLETKTGTGICKHIVPLNVSGRRLEDFVYASRRIAFLKIDTEGYDHHILKSISDIVMRDRPIIMTEVFTDLSDAERRDFHAVVNELNYAVDGASSDEEVASKFMTRHGHAIDLLLFPK